MRVHALIDGLGTGGAENLLSDLAVGARDAGVQLSVGYFTASGETVVERLRANGVEPVLVPISSLLGRRDRRLVREHLAAVAPDVLHTHLGYADVLGGLAARSLGVPAVSTIHGADWVRAPRDRIKERLMASARRRCARKVIAVSDAERRRYLELGRDRPEHVVTVNNGIVDGARPGSGEAIRAELGIGPRERVVVMLGALRPGKGHALAVEAITALSPGLPGLRLLIVGDGTERESIERGAAGLGDAAVLTGYRGDVMEILDAADLLIHPTSSDAFPTALIEAGAARLAAVATDVGGVAEILIAGETGLTIPAPPRAGDLAAAIERALGDDNLRRRLGAAGRARFERYFTAERWIERLLPVYRDAIGSSSEA